MARRTMYLIVEHVAASRHGFYAGCNATESSRPLMAFHSQEKAIGHAQRLEREARLVLPPFLIGQPDRWCGDGVTALVERLTRLGLRDLPSAEVVAWEAAGAWRRWWDAHGGELTPEQVAAIWKVMDAVELYRVVAVPVK